MDYWIIVLIDENYSLIQQIPYILCNNNVAYKANIYKHT